MIPAPRTPVAFLKIQELATKLRYGPATIEVSNQEKYVRLICAAIPGALCEIVGGSALKVYLPRHRRRTH